MRPPICHVCNATPEPGEARDGRTGEWIAFADYEPLPERMVGHPRALGWFCPEHVAAARALSSKSMREALAELEDQGVLTRIVRFFRTRFGRSSRS
jgi:hypothetical protein